MNQQEIIVSVICATYNQIGYIEQTLRSLLMQKTTFRYEVLVHDDASTDGTTDVVKRFEKEYPDRMTAVCQTVNQYSQGISPLNLLMTIAQGRYLAICEGDDYWTSPYKLQKQVEALEANPQCDMCAHEATMVDAVSGKVLKQIAPLKEDGILTMEQVIRGGGTYLSTNSLMCRREIAVNPTDYELLAPFDYCMQMHGAARGGIVYLAESMSAYRRGADNSWTLKMQKNPKQLISHYQLMKKVLDMVDRDTDKVYASTIAFEQKKYDFEIAVAERNGVSIFGKDMKDVRQGIRKKRLLILALMCYAPWIFDLIMRYKSRFRKYE